MSIYENRLVFLERSSRFAVQPGEKFGGGGAGEKSEVNGGNKVDGVINGVQQSIDSQKIAQQQGYDTVGEYRDGVAVARKEEAFFVVNAKGQRVDKKSYVDASKSFSEGKLAVKEGSKWHYIDMRGKDLKFGEFDEAWSFYHGVAVVRNGAYWKFIKADAERLNEKNYSSIANDFEDGVVAHGKRGEKWYGVGLDGGEVEDVEENGDGGEEV